MLVLFLLFDFRDAQNGQIFGDAFVVSVLCWSF